MLLSYICISYNILCSSFGRWYTCMLDESLSFQRPAGDDLLFVMLLNSKMLSSIHFHIKQMFYMIPSIFILTLHIESIMKSKFVNSIFNNKKNSPLLERTSFF